MPSRSAVKVSEKQLACRKLTSLLQKEYGHAVPQFSLPVLETMLFAACLEDNSWSAALEGYERLHKNYYDLNEIRVSSVAEIEETLSDLRAADWKGLRIRGLLRFVFESTYSFQYEKLKRLTLDSAHKRLKRIESITPFIRSFTLQQSLSGYLLCLDTVSTMAAIRLGIVHPGVTEEQAAEFLKPGLKKADTFSFAWYLLCLATDQKYQERLSDPPDEMEKLDVTRVEQRYKDLKNPPRRRKQPAAKKARGRSAATEKSPRTKKTAAKPKSKAAGARSRSKKSAGAKPVAKKTVTKKTAAKKTTATKKLPAKKKAAAKSTVAARKRASAGKTAKKKAGKTAKKKTVTTSAKKKK